MLWIWNRSAGQQGIALFEGQQDELRADKQGNNIVNELMLSANELNIYGTSGLIEMNYKNGSSTSFLQQMRNNPENAYKFILKKKIDKLNQQKPGETDFSIKPVPK